MLTMPIATLALSLLLPEKGPIQGSSDNKTRLAIFLFTVTAVIFRSEVALLLFCHIIYMMLKQTARSGQFAHVITLLRSTVIPAGILGVSVGLCMTILVDSYFWQSSNYLWPELSAFLSNIFPSDKDLGASAWGTQSWHWYFSSALPRLLMNPLICSLLWIIAVSNPATSQPVLDLLLPNLAYIATYSLLSHKETRFIFPVIPPITLAASLSASYIWTRRSRTLLYRLLSILLVSSTFLSALLAHGILLPLSALSYPGAHALHALHDHAASDHNSQTIENTILIHLDNLSTQTGITRFLQHEPPSKVRDALFIYDKSENTTNLLDAFWWTQFDYAIMESPQLAIGSWDVISQIRGLGPLRILRSHEKREKAGLEREGEKVDVWIDGIDMVAREMYGHVGLQISVGARLILREGYGTQRLLGRNWSWTRGWWADVGWIPKLYVLKQRESLAKEELNRVAASDAEMP
jgi:alpha-1,6-mannosyltransferase